ncbi:MAG: TetR/AcrR family transcriptional regulator [Gemmataceae bacterium]|nr:TetR/AcrR family transcriptional regulator [Gemmataceae bacterium]
MLALARGERLINPLPKRNAPAERTTMAKIISTARMRKADRKLQLMEHAKSLFVTLGYQDTTTEKIAQAAGVTEPILYRHFHSKKSLFLEVLTDIRESTIHRWENETASIADPLERLHAIVDLYLGSTKENALDFQIMHRSLVNTDDADIADCLRAFYLDSEKMLANVIREGQATGVFREDLDPRVGSWELIRTALGYTLTLPLDIPIYRDPAYVPQAITCMLRCLLA